VLGGPSAPERGDAKHIDGAFYFLANDAQGGFDNVRKATETPFAMLVEACPQSLAAESLATTRNE
jgi:hypothetical protein